jgi:DNA-directed RNA polymerase subunit RPC12/RpoP
MAFVLDCPSCKKAVTIDPGLIGRLVACPHCSGYFSVAMPPGAVAPVAVAAPHGGAAPTRRRFTFSCQRCGSVLEAIGEQCGQTGRCPTCGAVFVVPPVDPETGTATEVAVVADDGQLPTPMHAYATAGDRAPKIVRRETGEQVIVCPRCRREMPIDADGCTACGVPFTLEGAETRGIGGAGGGGAVEAGDNNLATGCAIILRSGPRTGGDRAGHRRPSKGRQNR